VAKIYPFNTAAYIGSETGFEEDSSTFTNGIGSGANTYTGGNAG
jgi:hypothetical protein